MKPALSLFSVALIAAFLAGCVSLPEGITPVERFDSERYLGRWYEVARLDNRFEKGLSKVTATYSSREDGGINVVNGGVSEAEGKAKEARGRAYFVKDSDTGHLKVSFFGPFYASYVVFHLDPEYQFAFVSGNSRKYLWLLSRTPAVDTSVRELFLKKANELGFDTDRLVWVRQ